MTRWITIEKAASETGFPVSYFHDRTGVSGCWPEGPVWKSGFNGFDSCRGHQ